MSQSNSEDNQSEGEIDIEDGEDIAKNDHNQMMNGNKKELQKGKHTIRRACCRSEFEFDEQLIFPESIYIDYKHYNWPIVSSQITKKMAIEIISFLNCSGGALLIGINDSDYRVKGISMNSKSREEFQKYVDDKILCFIHPIVKNEIQITFIPIKQGDQWKKNLYVIRILIQQGKPDELYTFSSENYEMISSIRRQSSCFPLKQDHIKYEIQQRMKYPIRQVLPHICIEENQEGIFQSCQISELEKNHNETMLNKNSSLISEEQNNDDNNQQIIVQFIQNTNNSVNAVSKEISNVLTTNSIKFSKINQSKQVLFKILKKSQSKQALKLLSEKQDFYNQHSDSLVRILFEQNKIFQQDIQPSKVIIIQNIDRSKIQSLTQFLMNEIEGIYILPLEYSFMIQVDDIKEVWSFLNRKRKILTKYSFKNVDVRYGISDNMKITISNLGGDKQTLEDFQKYFESISVGIQCKGEDNDDQVTLYFQSFIDYIIASERLQFLMYSDSSFRQFGKNQKIYINLEILSK